MIVMGCLSERYRAELEDELPEVDEYYGKFDFENLTLTLSQGEGTEAGCYPAKLTKPAEGSQTKPAEGSQTKPAEGSQTKPAEGCAPYERKLTTPKHYAYLKISEGCNRMCSYCAIPLITGRHTSRPMEEILDEVRWLVKQGVKEINVIAQDLSSYGLDLVDSRSSLVDGRSSLVDGSKTSSVSHQRRHLLPELIDQMAQIEGVEWIRLHYAYPTDFPEGLLDVMAKHKNVCKYLDIALQHCTDHMLGLMRRHITRAEQDALIHKIRERVPGICIRTTLLVGHPGETEEDFEELKSWVKEMRFERMGCFAYSDEEGTYANKHYKDDIPQEVKERRVEELMAIQQGISGELMQRLVGTVQRVVIDRKEGEYFIGRTQFDSPEVDCEVLIEKLRVLSPREARLFESLELKEVEELKVGEFYNVEITNAEEFDLYGEVVGR